MMTDATNHPLVNLQGRAGVLMNAAKNRIGMALKKQPGTVSGTAKKVRSSEVERVTAALHKLFTDHGVEARVAGVTRGPAVTRYGIRPGAGVKVEKVVGLADNIRLELKTALVRIERVIEGRSWIGVEVPNRDRTVVRLPALLASVYDNPNPLLIAAGADVGGEPMVLDLAKLVHLLVAGATGAGKSTFLHALLTSLLARATPDQVQLLLIDPKRVELTAYADVPHLVTPIVTDPGQAVMALEWLAREMDRRYELLKAARVRDIRSYNDKARRNGGEILSYLVSVIDELADLMLVAGKEIEGLVVRITQLARAAGIHLVLATQRPSVDVVTGLIKANTPTRVAFATTSQVDSRTILDEGGAETLTGDGDGLITFPGLRRILRFQGAYVSEAEIEQVVEAACQHDPVGLADVGDAPVAAPVPAEVPSAAEPDDEALYREAAELVVTSQFGSTSMLQRKLKIGYAKAGRLMDLMEARGVVGPANGSKARDVLVKPEG